MLRHNQITGSRYVILDGLEIPGSRGRTAIVSAVEIGFTVRRLHVFSHKVYQCIAEVHV
jgi:hypothetical protein